MAVKPEEVASVLQKRLAEAGLSVDYSETGEVIQIGDGVAIPHGKLNAIDYPIISFGKSEQGLDFDSMDGQPAYLFFMLIAPENSSGIHLQVLAKIAKILKSGDFRKKLMGVETKRELYQTIIDSDEES